MTSATTVMIVTQNRHVKKAKLLAEHRKSAESATSGVKVGKQSCCTYSARLNWKPFLSVLCRLVNVVVFKLAIIHLTIRGSSDASKT